MKAEVISVGTELLLGHTVNTDTTFVARELSALGIDLRFACIVGDNSERLGEAVKDALSRSDIIITTGGLGPTGDDLTKETVAEAAGSKLVLHEESMQRLESYFKGRQFGPTQKKQAYLPEGCTVLQNDAGTAPGCALKTKEGKIIIMLPGPPSELVPMLKNYAVPYLQQFSESVLVSRMIRVFGIGEGQAAEMIADFTDCANPTAATYAKENEMFIRVTAKAKTEQEAAALCEPVVQEITKRMGDSMYGVDVESLEQVVVQKLAEKRLTLATAESCTGGLVAKRITDIPGSSDVFHMGAVTYANDTKHQLLGVSQEMLKEYGAVSEQVARAMAEGICKTAGSRLGLGITGVAGPGGGTKEKPVGLVYMALSDGTQTWVRKMNPVGRVKGREWVRDRAANYALDMVRRYLADLPVIP